MKYPNFYVSAVEYNSDNTHIAKLRVHVVDQKDGSFNGAKYEDLTRPAVIKLIGDNNVFKTIIKVNGQWKVGSSLEIVPMTTNYLKTKKDNSSKDNLENLPTF